MSELPFAIMPVEVAMDGRLTLRQIRVLIALLSFRNRSTNLICPSRDMIAERTGLGLSRVSTVTTELVELGWLEKVGNGGRSMACRYVFKVPEFLTATAVFSPGCGAKTVPESVTVTKSETVTDSVTKTVPDSVTKTVPDSGTGKEQTREQTKEQTIPVAQLTPSHSNRAGDVTKAREILVGFGLLRLDVVPPELIAVIGDGATMDDVRYAGNKAADLGKGVGYALGIVRGLLADRRRQAEAVSLGLGEMSGGQRGNNRAVGGNSRIEHSRRLGAHLDRCIEAEFGAGVGVGVV